MEWYYPFVHLFSIIVVKVDHTLSNDKFSFAYSLKLPEYF